MQAAFLWQFKVYYLLGYSFSIMSNKKEEKVVNYE